MIVKVWNPGGLQETQNCDPTGTMRAEVVGRMANNPNCLKARYYNAKGECVMEGYLGRGARIYTSGRWWDNIPEEGTR